MRSLKQNLEEIIRMNESLMNENHFLRNQNNFEKLLWITQVRSILCKNQILENEDFTK